MKFHAQSLCSLGEISEKPSWKLENLVSTIYKTISNIPKHIFLKLLTNQIHICTFFTMDEVLVGKVTISANLKKINFPKISEQAPLKQVRVLLVNMVNLTC